MDRNGRTRVGTTYGLAGTTNGTCGHECPEQVYVNRLDDDVRPVQIEGWVGYGVDSRMNLTTRQARELIPLLVNALALVDDAGEELHAAAALRVVLLRGAHAEINRAVDSAVRQLEGLKR